MLFVEDQPKEKLMELFDITMGAFALAKMFQLYRHYYNFMCPFFFFPNTF